MKNLHLKLLALTLCALGAAGTWYKVSVIGLPLQPDAETLVWTVEARINFRAEGGPSQLHFHIPSGPLGFTVLGEDFVSGPYGLAREVDGNNRVALWTARRASGEQSLYYRIRLAEDRNGNDLLTGPQPPFPAVPDYPEPYGSAAMALLEDVRQESADIASFTRRLLLRYNADTPDEGVKLLREEADNDLEHTRNIIHILAGARIPARMVMVLQLRDRMRRGNLESYLEVHNGSEWIPFNPRTGQRGYGDDLLAWYRGDAELLTSSGISGAQVEFSAARTVREMVSIAEQRAAQQGSLLMDFSLLSLPVQTQNMYRILLMVPIGALVMVFMRNVVGVSTFGTFMPILIALAFRETQLLWGIFLFTVIVAAGLAIRFYLENLKLLLVPRLASVLIVVVLLLALISILSHKLGLDRGLSVALFPMVILAMTIERMSLVWEEHGPNEAIKQGLGSLAVAVVGYAVMFQEQLEHLIFYFPELLLVVLAVTLLMGRYTGYRLTELWRFRHLLRAQERS
ncbi:MAG: inactive transglutaminase family protein [Ectothiorhodospiraceae bacterium]|nr:inactive transglutaminase family protein [Ectothiorhodospiraceae bacterium]